MACWEQARGLEEPAGGSGEAWSEAEAKRFYQTVLKDAGEIANRSVGKGFEDHGRKRGSNPRLSSEKSGGA